LSLAELLVVLASEVKEEIKILDCSFEVLIIESTSALNVEKLQAKLGGTIKILKIIDLVKKREQDSVNFALRHYFKPSKLKSVFLKNYKGKIQFGVSIYLLDPNVQAFGEPMRLGMFIKRALQDAGSSIRLVLPEFNSLALASVVVTKNLLLSKGAEIGVLVGPNKVYVTKTLTVQDFEDYGRRDYQRPVRSELQGMIPPKVAQIMLNLANVKTNSTILDPFCGLGTIPQEAILLGLRALGTDINPVAISGSEKNLEWFRNRYKVPPGKYHLDVSDARKVSSVVQNLAKLGGFKEIAGIVTEGYLGPLYSQFPKLAEMEKNFKELTGLYEAAFAEFTKFLPKKARVVLCLPAYKKNQKDYEMFPTVDFITKLGYNLVDLIPEKVAKSFKFLKLTPRGTAIYDRKDQIVAREIIVFEKI